MPTQTVQPITPEQIRDASKAARDSAPGLDGWAIKDMRHLPLVAFKWLSALYDKVECGHAWPTIMHTARA
eukprot:14044552-Alexandrium_andersonii.AAC.1